MEIVLNISKNFTYLLNFLCLCVLCLLCADWWWWYPFLLTTVDLFVCIFPFGSARYMIGSAKRGTNSKYYLSNYHFLNRRIIIHRNESTLRSYLTQFQSFDSLYSYTFEPFK